MLQVERILALIEPPDPARSTVAAQAALQRAASMALTYTARLVVLPLPRAEEASSGSPDISTEAVNAFVSRILRAQTPDATAPVFDVLEQPSHSGALLEAVAATNPGLIVADTPADRGPIPVLASEPIAGIARDTDVPLFVAGHRSVVRSVRRILVPTDFSEHSRVAFAHATALAAQYDAALDILHVLERPQYVALNPTDLLAMNDATLPERKARRRTQTFVESLNGNTVPTRIHLDHGNAPDRIGRFVDENESDLVVLSTHGIIGRSSHPFGTVAEKVLRRVTRPVFLTRAFGRSLVRDMFSEAQSDGAADGLPYLPSTSQ